MRPGPMDSEVKVDDEQVGGEVYDISSRKDWMAAC